MLGVNEVKANFQNDCLLKVQFIRFKIETQSLGRVGGICGRLLRAPYFLGAPLALALLPKIESGARARALTQN